MEFVLLCFFVGSSSSFHFFVLFSIFSFFLFLVGEGGGGWRGHYRVAVGWLVAEWCGCVEGANPRVASAG